MILTLELNENEVETICIALYEFTHQYEQEVALWEFEIEQAGECNEYLEHQLTVSTELYEEHKEVLDKLESHLRLY